MTWIIYERARKGQGEIVTSREKVQRVREAKVYGVLVADNPEDSEAEFGWRFFTSLEEAVDIRGGELFKDVEVFEFTPVRLGVYRKEMVYIQQRDEGHPMMTGDIHPRDVQ